MFLTDKLSLIAYLIANGVEVPHYCYHNYLSIAGNCRICLVELNTVMKPVVSCATNAQTALQSNKIYYDSPLVKKSRENVLEFLLLNHPLDCPICDQGGDCDLQDQSLFFGATRRRFHKFKRVVSDKELGPIIKTVMARCIHCTRCVRFAKEIAGVEDLGMLGRGYNSEIGTYINKVLTTELSGNMIDLCPVAAFKDDGKNDSSNEDSFDVSYLNEKEKTESDLYLEKINECFEEYQNECCVKTKETIKCRLNSLIKTFRLIKAFEDELDSFIEYEENEQRQKKAARVFLDKMDAFFQKHPHKTLSDFFAEDNSGIILYEELTGNMNPPVNKDKLIREVNMRKKMHEFFKKNDVDMYGEKLTCGRDEILLKKKSNFITLAIEIDSFIASNGLREALYALCYSESGGTLQGNESNNMDFSNEINAFIAEQKRIKKIREEELLKNNDNREVGEELTGEQSEASQKNESNNNKKGYSDKSLLKDKNDGSGLGKD